MGLTVTDGPPGEGEAEREIDPENALTLERVTVSEALDP